MTTGMVAELCPGMHSVTVTDANGCLSTASVDIVAPEILEITVDSVTHITAGLNGTIDISVSGGVAGYQYVWSGPNGYTANTEDLINLSEPGCFVVTVTDANGCTAEMDGVCIEDHTSSILDVPDSSIKVYPNPANTFLNICLQDPSVDFTCILYSCDGTPVESYSQAQVIDLTKTLPGIYILRVMISNGQEKLVKIVVTGS
jgi:hypothetical protein